MTKEYTGGSVSYYKVHVSNPTTIAGAYDAECNDIIEALGMNYAEGNAFKAIWRSCAARSLGLSKQGYTDGLYDAEKALFFSGRMVKQAASEQCQPVEEARKTGGFVSGSTEELFVERASDQCYPRDIPSWEDVKEDHFWMAQDDNGAWFSFPALPYIDEFDEWYTEAGYEWLDYKSESCEFWRDSLNCRPQQ